MRLNMLLRSGVKVNSQYQEYGDNGLLSEKTYFGYDNDVSWQHQALLQIDTEEEIVQVHLSSSDQSESSQFSFSMDTKKDREKTVSQSSKTSSHFIDFYA
ncbi:hypothetical protein [Methylophaga sulfidovorans]|nr:hypothetical protein [Methylophaga sulfidovorans]